MPHLHIPRSGQAQTHMPAGSAALARERLRAVLAREREPARREADAPDELLASLLEGSGATQRRQP